MTDKELLEKAAKAINGGAWHPLTHDTPGRRAWNPLTDDGDALRLAVQLHISTYIAPSGMVMAISHDGKANFKEDSPADPLAAIRRAIVRAAAALADAQTT